MRGAFSYSGGLTRETIIAYSIWYAGTRRVLPKGPLDCGKVHRDTPAHGEDGSALRSGTPAENSPEIVSFQSEGHACPMQ